MDLYSEAVGPVDLTSMLCTFWGFLEISSGLNTYLQLWCLTLTLPAQFHKRRIFVHLETAQQCEPKNSKWDQLAQKVRFWSKLKYNAHLQESLCCHSLERSLPWRTQCTVLLGVGVPTATQIVNSLLHFFLGRTSICSWNRLSSVASCDSKKLDMTHRMTLMTVVLYTGVSYTAGWTCADSDHKTNLCSFEAICAFQILCLLCQSSTRMS